jgi:hydroxymethylpyrimidine pyrophosphatase-like HAD family hydrolase
MRYLALAVDYDGTLATHGQVPADAVAALRRLKASGRKLILVTGRTLADIRRVFGDWNVFDRVVAENGGVLYQPANDTEHVLAAPPPPALVEALEQRGVTPVRKGRVLVATMEPHHTAVLEVVRDLGLEHQIVFNKGSIMVVPSGVSKKTGLQAALDSLGLSAHNVVSIGDAENDHAFLEASECAVAVANALPSIKDSADIVTRGTHAAGVVDIVERLLDHDLDRVKRDRHRIRLGRSASRRKSVDLPPYGTGLLVAGTPRAGKSSLMLALFEAIRALDYQVCLIDPEGDFERLPSMVGLGDPTTPPTVEEVVGVLDHPSNSVCVSLLAIPGEARPRYFAELARALGQLHATTGRPHWLLLDEAHHLLPAGGAAVDSDWGWQPGGLVLITVSPPRLASATRGMVTHVLALGKDPAATVEAAAALLGAHAPSVAAGDLPRGQGLLWRLGKRRTRVVRLVRSTIKRRRHRRKYMEGGIPEQRSFYFTGPDRTFNLRAQNLQVFVQLAERVDSATWEFHRQAGDFSRWIGTSVKDRKLARAIALVERDARLGTDEARAQIRQLVEARYAPPA